MVPISGAAHHGGMETTNEQPWAAPGSERPRRLSRQASGRMLGGVAGGTAAYLGMDPVIVRIGFVALTLFGGLGVILYAIGWLLIPEDGSEESLAQHALSGREPGQHRWLAIVVGVVAVIAVFGLFSNGPMGWGRGWGTGWSFGFGLFWVVLAAVLVLAITRVKGVHRMWKVLGLMILSLIAIVVVTVGGAFAAVAISGVPLHGGVGDREWRPTAPGQLQHDYRLAIGNMTVDLRNVTFPAGSTSITASVGMGHLLVEVPPGVSVSVNAHSGLGAVVYGDGHGNTDPASFGNGSSSNSGIPSTAHLNLTATTGVGVVQLDRSQGAFP
jgi:phage shock protein PspC (stress-responsive transcriptional regulator)